ncbi:MAG: hypothetical protein H6737_23085 [Alphaproteobacteria bacterium]|nr:hypothetical protein [Alphaproteobacteria bacterium]
MILAVTAALAAPTTWTEAACALDIVAARSLASTDLQRGITEVVAPHGRPYDYGSLVPLFSMIEEGTSEIELQVLATALESWAGTEGEPINDQLPDDPMIRARLAFEPPTSRVVLPMVQAETGTWKVKVQVNGRDAWFGLDTGASMNTVSKSFVEKGHILGALEIDNHNQAGAATFGTVQLGIEGLGTDERVMIVLKDKALGRHGLDGLLGWPFFAGMRVTLDGAAGELILEPPGDEAPNSTWSFGMLLVRGTVEGADALLWLDTGGDGAVYASARKRGVPIPESEVYMRPMAGLSGRMKMQVEDLAAPLTIGLPGGEFSLKPPKLVEHGDRSHWCVDVRVGATAAEDAKLVVDGKAGYVGLTTR